MKPPEFLRHLFDVAVAAADPANCVPPHLPPPPRGRTIVIAAGKAAASMARAVEDNWPGPVSGIAVTRYGHGCACRFIEVIEAGHPLPDDSGVAAAGRIIKAVTGLDEDDLVLCLISGGGSALMTLPAPGLTLADKQNVVGELLRCGASISEINVVRKHLSAIKGGRLAQAASPAQIVTLAISDVPGDDPATIASGPTVGDASTLADAIQVIAKHGISTPESVARHLGDPAHETPVTVAGAEPRIVARAADALGAAADAARRAGVHPIMLGDDLEGEASALARDHAKLVAASIAAPAAPAVPAAPVVLISGGEATVSLVAASGKGGPNAEYALGLMIALAGRPGVFAIACDTDGIDGSEDNAGALVMPDGLAAIRAAGMDPASLLREHRSYDAFAAIGGLVNTGPTRTNVNDFRAIMITAGAKANIDL